jgi:hypothetical protein
VREITILSKHGSKLKGEGLDMDKERVVAIRDKFKALKFKLYKRDGSGEKEFTPLIQIVCDNSLNVVDDNMGNVIWDDDNAIFYWFKGNCQSSTSYQAGISNGVALNTPYLCIGIDYDEIQNIRVALNQECFDQLSQSLSLTDDQKKYIEDMILSESDMRNVIVRKQNTSYVTSVPEKYTIPVKDDNKVYDKTIHAGQWGAV